MSLIPRPTGRVRVRIGQGKQDFRCRIFQLSQPVYKARYIYIYIYICRYYSFPTGLAMLSVSELRSMCEEMRAKFQRLSGVLISELQLRDQQVHELDVRNRFISAMLHVQNQRHGFGVNGSMDGLLRGRTWTRSARGKEEKYSGKVGCV